MRIAIVGGGPGGLYLAALMKQLDAGHEVTVWERNAPDDTFGFGVVFSDETLGGIESADTTIYRAMESRFARWTDIDVAIDGTSSTIGGQGFGTQGFGIQVPCRNDSTTSCTLTPNWPTTAETIVATTSSTASAMPTRVRRRARRAADGTAGALTAPGRATRRWRTSPPRAARRARTPRA